MCVKESREWEIRRDGENGRGRKREEEREHDRKPKGHLKVSGVFLAALPLHVLPPPHTHLLFLAPALSDMSSHCVWRCLMGFHISHYNMQIFTFLIFLVHVAWLHLNWGRGGITHPHTHLYPFTTLYIQTRENLQICSFMVSIKRWIKCKDIQ